ncbi:MAG: hypothetical protein FWF49_06075, partial [Oscillospiraceae bacterium]|nr:hypothetical protein [Oscillospiraceae bacterium]
MPPSNRRPTDGRTVDGRTVDGHAVGDRIAGDRVTGGHTINPRAAAVDALLKIRRAGGYSNLVLNAALESNKAGNVDGRAIGDRVADGRAIDGRDAADNIHANVALTTRLVYGVVERALALDYLINTLAAAPSKIHPGVREVLRVALYQLLFMDRIPPHAAVDAAVREARRFVPGAGGFVNALLRRAVREALVLLETAPAGARLCCPPALLELFTAAYGWERTEAYLTYILQGPPPLYLRVNPLKTTAEAFRQKLAEADIPYETDSVLPLCMKIMNAGHLKSLEKSLQNCYHVQDKASQIACALLGVQPGEKIADVCAAPGGKTLTLAGDMQNSGHILACDLHAFKCEALSRRLAAFVVTIAEVQQTDAATLSPADAGLFDRVLCDAPCSGLGVLRRKPEIRYKPPASFAGLPEQQLAILRAGAALTRPGGLLQYCTCTLNPAENEAVA